MEYGNELDLYVFAAMPNGDVLKVGRLLSQNLNSQGHLKGYFLYDSNYLNHSKVYPVDPVNLPLIHNKVFDAPNFNTGVHSVFEDSLPDAWGRQLLARQGNLDLQRCKPVHLLSVLNNKGLGRLMYSQVDDKPEIIDNSIPFRDIIEAIREAELLEESVDVNSDELQHVLGCGSSAGGARPKVLTKKEDILYLAKLSSIKDPDPKLFASLENAGMTLARQAGLQVPDFEVHNIGKRNVFLIERFDISREGGRNAMISFKTMTGAEDYYEVNYSDLAEVLRRFSYQPERDVELFYRQMVVNVMLRNADDHLQNFAMLHTTNGLRLSPAYDIVPNIYQSGQILKVNGKHDNIERPDLLAEGKEFGLSAQKSKQLLNDVINRMKNWTEIFDKCGVSKKHTGKLRYDIEQRFSKISTQAKSSIVVDLLKAAKKKGVEQDGSDTDFGSRMR